jgi:hypothetical protein
MSISFPAAESGSTPERLREQHDGAKRATSAARVGANRRNARKSTGPRTIEGKRRSSRNAMKHGLCRTLSCLPSECEATFLTFVAELRAELCPATALQRLVFNQIASLTWRIERLPEAQTKLFAEELGKVASSEDESRVPEMSENVRGCPISAENQDVLSDRQQGHDAECEVVEALSPSDVLARRFSDAPQNNGFALMERYERGMRNQLLRLMRQFDQLKKQRASTPYDPNEEVEMRRAKYEQQLRDDEERYQENRERNARRDEAEREAARESNALPGPDADPGVEEGPGGGPAGSARAGAPAGPPAGLEPGEVNALIDAAPVAKQTQTNPTTNRDSERRAGKCTINHDAPATERSQRGAATRRTPRPRSPGSVEPPQARVGGSSGDRPSRDSGR